jgi:hypothetical protein
MKALVMYESMFGNSERVARAVAEGLGDLGEVVVGDVTSSPTGEIPADVDLLVVGGPTHAFSMSRPNTREDAIRQGAPHGLAQRGLREWLGGLPSGVHLPACATFDTRVSRARRLPGSAARSAARMLRRRHGRMVAAPASFYVEDVSGPLGTDELGRARDWGRHLAAAVLSDDVEAS